MTRDEILNMPAGREMDALIAENITGWEAEHRSDKCDGEYFIKCGACGASGHGNCYGNGDGAIQIKCGEYATCCDEAWMPEYSTDISAAWEVVEKLRLVIVPKTEGLNGWLVKWDNKHIYSSGGDENEKNPMIGWPEMEWLSHLAVADTAPLAICRAALLAVLEKEERE